MQLHAVVAVPEGVVRATLDAAPEVVAAAFPAPVEEAGRGLLARWRRRPSEPAAPAVTFVPAAPEAVFVRMAKFGNVTADVAGDLAAALEQAAGTWRVPALRVSRLVVADAAPFDVTAQLEGDVDALRTIYAKVLEVAQEHRFYLDRRNFRSEVVIGRLAAGDGGDVPETVAGAEMELDGATWSPPHLTLLRSSFSAGTGFTDYARIDLGDTAQEQGLGLRLA